jgi:pyrroline-5-carboxylate reductase
MNKIEKTQATVELAGYIGNALVDIGKGLSSTMKYGYRPAQITPEDAKQAMDAINNVVKVFSNNEDEIKLCETLSSLAKAYFDYCANQNRR